MMLGWAKSQFPDEYPPPGIENIEVSNLHFMTLQLMISDSDPLTFFYAQRLSKNALSFLY